MAILFDWYENPKTKDRQGEEVGPASPNQTERLHHER